MGQERGILKGLADQTERSIDRAHTLGYTGHNLKHGGHSNATAEPKMPSLRPVDH